METVVVDGGKRPFSNAILTIFELKTLIFQTAIPAAAWTKPWVCERSLAGISGSNPPGGMNVSVSCECCVLLGRGLCDRPITRPEESHRV